MALESRDSSSPIITRAVAAALAGQTLDVFTFARWQKLILSLANRLPQRAAIALARWDSGRCGLPISMAKALVLDDLLQERLRDYSDLEGKVDSVVIGAALGGAAAHLCASLGAPFLPQPFILGFKGGSPDDDIHQHLENALEIAQGIADGNPGLLLISHFDPIHDGWLTRNITHMRIKLRYLPNSYAQFIKKHLRPGGSIVYLDCGLTWPQYELSPHHHFQVGGWGGLQPHEYLDGSEQIDAILAQRGSPHRGPWRLDGVPLQQHPESEWGTTPGLGSALSEFCCREGYAFLRLQLPHPDDFSHLAFLAQLERCRLQGIEPQGVIVETFTQYAPTMADRASLLPLWLIFNTWDSLAFLERMMAKFPADKPVFFSGLITFSETPDMVPFEEWNQVLQQFRWVNIGPRAARYPADLEALWRWPEALRRWVADHPKPLTKHLVPSQLEHLAARIVAGSPD